MNKLFMTRLGYDALKTVWRTLLGIFAVIAAVAAFISFFTAVGVIEGNPVTVLWEAPADMARAINALVQLGDSLEGVDFATWFDETTAAAAKFNSQP